MKLKKFKRIAVIIISLATVAYVGILFSKRIDQVAKDRESMPNFFDKRFKKNKELIMQRIKDFEFQKDYIRAYKIASNYCYGMVYSDPELLNKCESLSLQADVIKYKEVADANARIAAEENLKRQNEYLEKRKLEKRKERLESLEIGARPAKRIFRDSYSAIETYLKENANDPESINVRGCDSPEKTSQGWRIKCSFWMKNEFSANMKYRGVFFLKREKVIEAVLSKDSALKPSKF